MRFPLHASASAILLAAALASPSAFADPPAAPPPAASPPPTAPTAPLAEPQRLAPDVLESLLPPRRSTKKPAMLVSGIVVSVLGAGLLGGGAVVAATSRPFFGDDIGKGIGTTMMVFGVLHAAVGVPLILNGKASYDAQKPAAYALALPAITAGPGSVTMRWVF